MRKQLALESLRGIAALTVAIYHFKSDSFLVTNAFVAHGYLMVDLFFVLSGFVLTLNYNNKFQQFSDILIFQKKRFWRLYPLHFVMLFVYLGIEIAKYIFEQQTHIIANNPAFSVNNLTAFLNHLILTQSIFLSELTFNAPTWSISVEFYTYILFALCLFVFKNRVALIFLAIGIISLVFFVSGRQTFDVYATYYTLFRCFYSFFLGSVFYFIKDFFVNKKYISMMSIFWTLCSILVVMYLAKTSYEFCVPIIFALMIIHIYNLEDNMFLNKIFKHKYLVYLGSISYSIYMLHTSIWWTMTQILRFIFHVHTSNIEGKTIVDLDVYYGTFNTVLGLVIILFLSHLSYKYIEQHYRM